jgi:hypothetical protein
MTSTIDTTSKTYLTEGTISVSNKHLFSPPMQELFDFMEDWGDKPINPIKYNEDVRIVKYYWKFNAQIIEKKQNNPDLPFKKLVSDLLTQLPNDWEAEHTIDLIVWAKKTWQSVN